MSGRPDPAPSYCRKLIPILSLSVVALWAGAVLRGDTPLDDQSPSPPAEPKRQAEVAETAIPNKDAAIFQGRRDAQGDRIPNTGIVDFEPVAAETVNPDEYQAWHTVVLHARQFSAEQLERNAATDLTRDDLTATPSGQPTANPRVAYRLSLLRFDGQLVKVRRVPASRSLVEAGTDETYEGLLLPLGEPFPADRDKVLAYAVWVVFTELPEPLAALRQRPPREWLEVNSWATAAGYFFKVKQDVREDPVPVIIGKSVRLLSGPPVPPGDNPAALDKNLRVFRLIKDDAFIAKAEENWEEVSAWNRVLLHARRFPPEELERYANGDLKFADLFLDSRRDYKLDLVRFEGRLIQLSKVKPSEKLAAAGVETAYEGWIVPRNEPRGNPICVFFTDPPEGIEGTGRVNKWVSFAGYFFKLLRYRSAERDEKDPSRNVVKRAPLLLGRAVIPRPDPDVPVTLAWGSFATTATIVVIGLVVAALGLTVYFRRSDRRARQEIEAHRIRNPFGEAEPRA